jgi:hypothetical protein
MPIDSLTFIKLDLIDNRWVEAISQFQQTIEEQRALGLELIDIKTAATEHNILLIACWRRGAQEETTTSFHGTT